MLRRPKHSTIQVVAPKEEEGEEEEEEEEQQQQQLISRNEQFLYVLNCYHRIKNRFETAGCFFRSICSLADLVSC